MVTWNSLFGNKRKEESNSLKRNGARKAGKLNEK